ncbi:lipopolysaccharide biosynthesis protein [Marinilabilia rubra]|uniref:Polysaccharide biosynthesis protein n=1 Tax=Marinilabilia rubra TaxID=2162893 RepID=A0A2U2BCP9_9BACT|nr:oligosaccharide flippase family protein [Marinilabilia rubra]PWE00839.1 polysaccharide biosynthesis protein [Marinilabilia rubra]
MKRKSDNILQASFPLFSASFFAQGINFLILFILPFFYSTQTIGQFFVFSALGLLIGPLVSFRSFNAILISDSKNLAEFNLGISIVLGGVTSFLFGGLLYFLSLFSILDIGEKIGAGYLLPVFVFLMSLFISFENFLNFQKRYICIGYAKLIKSFITLVLTLLFGVFAPSVFSIVIAFLFGQLSAVVYQINISRVTWRVIRFSKRKLNFFILKYKDILVFNSSLSVVSELNSHLPTVLLSAFYGDSVVAFYGMAQRIFSTPVSVLGNSIATVFGIQTVEYYNTLQHISKYFFSTIFKVSIIAIPFGVVSFLLAPLFFDSFFGEEWRDAGIISRIILPLIIVQNILMPVTILYTVLHFQKRVFGFYLISFFVRIVLLFILPYLLFDIDLFFLLAIFVVSGIIHYILYFKEFVEQIRSYESGLSSF